MLLDPNDPRIVLAPDSFESPFPSSDALESGKFLALINEIGEDGESIARAVYTRANAMAWRDALAFANKARVTTVGVLSEWLPNIASIGPLKGGLEGVRGLFAAVAFPDTTSQTRLEEVVGNVLLDVALDTVGAVPLVGGCMKFILGLGSLLDRLFGPKPPTPENKVFLPWSQYSDDTDTDVVHHVIGKLFRTVDLTRLFRPAYALDVPWTVATGVQDGKEVGRVWAPIKHGQTADSGGVGGMPGTWRIAGHVQAVTAKWGKYADDPKSKNVERYFASGQVMQRGRVLTDTADFFPATAQSTTLAWNQVNAAGSPDMYTVDTHLLEAEWAEYFDNFFDSVWREFKDKDEWAGEWAWPYLAVKINNQWQLGGKALKTRLDRPHPAPLVTPDIFTKGPATPATRNQCLYLEENAWGTIQQIGATPDYVRENGRIIASGGPAWNPKNPPPKTWCVKWPDPRELLVDYARPDTAILVPAIRRLRERQRACLRRTLACAYVRPLPVGDQPAYGAFAHQTRGKELRQLCLDMREQLLFHEARFAVILKDVDAVDRPFADKLRAAGVNNTPAQLHAVKLKFAGDAGDAGVGLGDDDDPIPDPIPPQGGLPFEPPEDDAGASRKPRGAGLAKLAAGGLAAWGLSKIL